MSNAEIATISKSGARGKLKGNIQVLQVFISGCSGGFHLFPDSFGKQE